MSAREHEMVACETTDSHQSTYVMLAFKKPFHSLKAAYYYLSQSL